MRSDMTKRRDFLKTMAVGGMALTVTAGRAGNAEASRRPNIILILNDDMGYSDIGCYGGEVKTPTLDRLAKNGLRFSQFYNTARCCPTRASLITGLYQHQAGVGHMVDDCWFEGYRGDLSDRAMTIAEVLSEAGYGTYMSGKWHVTKHLGPWTGDEKLMSKRNWPRQRGFDRFFGTIIGCGSFYDPVTLTLENTPVKPEGKDFYYTDAITDHAIECINDHLEESPDKPFFNYVAYTAPHWPMHALPGDIAKYRGRYDKGWDALRRERYERMIDMGIVKPEWDLTPRDSKVEAWEDTPHKEWQSRLMEVYAAMIDRMDQGIARIVENLEQKGQLDNTLIFFLADNGGCAEDVTAAWDAMFIPVTTPDGKRVIKGNNPGIMPGPADTYQSYSTPWANASNTPFRLYKHWVHEGGISTPLIVHWPSGITAKNEWRGQPGHLIDIMATCVDVSGAVYPDFYRGNRIIPMEGVSLAPAFKGKKLDREAIYWEHEGNKAIRRGKWKLVAKYRGDWELYDLEGDRTEMHDLAAEHPELVRELSDMWQTWADRAYVQPWEDIVKGTAEFKKYYNNRHLPR